MIYCCLIYIDCAFFVVWAKIDKIWIGQVDERKKLKFYKKYSVHNQKMIIFA